MPELTREGLGEIIREDVKKQLGDIKGELTDHMKGITEEFIQEMNDHGVTIHSAGGETADLGDLINTVVVDSTVTATAHNGGRSEHASPRAHPRAG